MYATGRRLRRVYHRPFFVSSSSLLLLDGPRDRAKMARRRHPFRCLPRRVPSARLCFALLSVALLVSLLLSLQLYQHPSVLAWSCQDGKVWGCPGKADDSRAPAVPLITVGTGAPYDSSVPSGRRTSRLSGAVTSLADDLSDFLTGSVGRPHGTTRWTYERDADHLGMTSQQCQAAFPGLFAELARARTQFQKFHIVGKDLDAIDISEGRVRAAVLGGEVRKPLLWSFRPYMLIRPRPQLSILKTNLRTQKSRASAIAILQSLHDAVSNPGEIPMPNIEFVISVNSHVPDLTKPLWVPDRREDDENVWLMPESRFVIEQLSGPAKSTGTRRLAAKSRRWIWGETSSKTDGSGKAEEAEKRLEILTVTKRRLISEIEDLEGSVPHQKRNRLVGVWRNGDTPGSARQKQLVRVADGRAWAETQVVIAGADHENSTKPVTVGGRKDHRKSLSEICRYLFLAHDSSFPISLTDGPLLCSSVILTTKPKWIQIYHPLMLVNPDNYLLGDLEHPVVDSWAADGAGRQNAVLAADDWGDVDVKMNGLLQFPDVAEAIAENNVETFRRRYMTNAATACYWREMIFAYKSVSYEPEVWVQEGTTATGETRRTRRGISWESFL